MTVTRSTQRSRWRASSGIDDGALNKAQKTLDKDEAQSTKKSIAPHIGQPRAGGGDGGRPPE
jgi:hypothetical protein